MSTQSDALRNYFLMNGVKNIDVAETLGLSTTTVSNMLTGHDRIGPKRAKMLHDIYGFDIGFLISGEGSLFPPSGFKRIEEVSGVGNIVQSAHSSVTIQADAAALQAENERLRNEVEWLREQLSKH